MTYFQPLRPRRWEKGSRASAGDEGFPADLAMALASRVGTIRPDWRSRDQPAGVDPATTESFATCGVLNGGSRAQGLRGAR